MLYHLSVFIHILAAMVWIGGMLFLALVVVPVVRLPQFARQKMALIHQLGLRFRTLGWITLPLLVVTGVSNLFLRGYRLHHLLDASFWQTPWGHKLAIKLVLVAVVLLISAAHDFYIGPRATRLLQENPGDPEGEKLRRMASRIGRLNLLLGFAIVYLAVALARNLAF